MLSWLEFKFSISTLQALRPLVYVFATTAHGEIYFAVLPFCLSALWNVSPILLCGLSPFQPPQQPQEEQETTGEATAKSSLCKPLQQHPAPKQSIPSMGQKLLHLLCRAPPKVSSLPHWHFAFLSVFVVFPSITVTQHLFFHLLQRP